MELKRLIEIFKENYKIFFETVLVVLVVGSGIYLLVPDKYRAEFDLNVTRTGYQKETTDYRYDEFYRLQADERFADTVVRWLGSNVIKNEITKKSSNGSFEKIKAERLSSQMIRVSFLVSDKKQAQLVTQAIDEVINNEILKLNAEQNNPQWFKVLTSYPIVSEYKIGWSKLILILISSGVFLGIWAVFVRHYLK